MAVEKKASIYYATKMLVKELQPHFEDPLVIRSTAIGEPAIFRVKHKPGLLWGSWKSEVPFFRLAHNNICYLHDESALKVVAEKLELLASLTKDAWEIVYG